MTTPKPTVILVHGAWHSPEHYKPLEKALGSHGYKTVSPWLPSMHYEQLNVPPVSGIGDDVAAIRQTIVAELDSHPAVDVVLVSHSYGTVPTAAAVEGLDKPSRLRAGHRNGVAAQSIISGLLRPAGISLLEWGGGQVPPTMALSSIPSPADPTREITVCTPIPDPGPVALFYHDLAERDPQAAEHYASICKPQVWAVHETPVPFVPWQPAERSEVDLGLFYLVCEQDRALPAVFQRMMIETADREIAEHQAGIEGENEASRIHVTSIDSGHCPFLSRVDETAQWVRRCCGEEVV